MRFKVLATVVIIYSILPAVINLTRCWSLCSLLLRSLSFAFNVYLIFSFYSSLSYSMWEQVIRLYYLIGGCSPWLNVYAIFLPEDQFFHHCRKHKSFAGHKSCMRRSARPPVIYCVVVLLAFKKRHRELHSQYILNER